MNDSQQIALAIVYPMASGISLFFAIIAFSKILKSNRRLMTPSSRMLCGMCVAIIIASIASVFSTLPIPKDTEGVWIALGTTATCEIQGFFYTLGSNMIPMYSGALCVYYMCVVKYSMSDQRFSKRIEPLMHGSIIAWSLFGITSALATGSINEAGSLCWIAPLPADCVMNEDVECVRGEAAYLWRTLGVFFPGILSFLLIIISLFTIFKKVRNQERSGERFRFSPSAPAVAGSRNRSTTRTSRRYRAIQNTIACYFLGGVVIFLASGIYRQMEMRQQHVPFALILTARICHPLQGFVNILIFIRPSAGQMRRSDPSITWFKALCIAFHQFDGHTEKDQVSRRRSSLRAFQLSRASMSPAAGGINNLSSTPMGNYSSTTQGLSQSENTRRRHQSLTTMSRVCVEKKSSLQKEEEESRVCSVEKKSSLQEEEEEDDVIIHQLVKRMHSTFENI